MAATGFRTMHVPRVYTVAGPAYGGAVLALYTQGRVAERALGVLTWLVLLCALWPLPTLARAQTLGVVGGLGVTVLGAVRGRSRTRAAYAGVFFVVAALELYGTSIGAWHWTKTLPGLGITDGNPPSGAPSGYVGFDVMATLVAPTIVYAAAKLKLKRATRPAATWLRSTPRIKPIQPHTCDLSPRTP